MDFKNLVKEIQEFKGVSRKSSINNVISLLEESYNVSGDVVIDIGDDASAINIGNNQVMLIAADGIWGDIMNVNPYWAGYCSVLVNVNDIAAMGGKPLAMVNIMSISNDDIYEDLLKGIKDGCLKFGVPMVGGHLHPDGEVDSLGVAIVGIAQKDKIITSFGAEVGDKVIVAIDLDGKPHEMFNLNWDTTYDKDAQIVRDQITAVQYLAEHDYIKSGKDISNPGILGTLEMLLETSKKGAVVNLEDIPRNETLSWADWLRSYPGSGFVFTASEDKCEFIKEYLADYSIEAAVVGEVTDSNSLFLNYKDEQAEVFNQEENPVFIFRWLSMRHLANYISVSRIFLSFLLLFSKPLSVSFFIIFILCGLSDILDGYIARICENETVFGSKLDSIADVIFFLAFLFVLWPVLNIDYGILLFIAVIFIIRISSILIGFVKFNKFAMHHTYLNKLAGLVLVLLPFLMLLFSSGNVLYFICMVALIASIEELFIMILSSDLDLNQKLILKKKKS